MVYINTYMFNLFYQQYLVLLTMTPRNSACVFSPATPPRTYYHPDSCYCKSRVFSTRIICKKTWNDKTATVLVNGRILTRTEHCAMQLPNTARGRTYIYIGGSPHTVLLPL